MRNAGLRDNATGFKVALKESRKRDMSNDRLYVRSRLLSKTYEKLHRFRKGQRTIFHPSRGGNIVRTLRKSAWKPRDRVCAVIRRDQPREQPVERRPHPLISDAAGKRLPRPCGRTGSTSGVLFQIELIALHCFPHRVPNPYPPRRGCGLTAMSTGRRTDPAAK